MTSCIRNLLAAFVVLGAHFPFHATAAEPIRMLFVGNSYTFYNDMPQIVQRMSVQAGQARPLEVKDVTFGGATLERHWQSGDVQKALMGKHWDYVVIQDHSLGPINHPDLTRKYVSLIAAQARLSGAQPILYLTWAREYNPATQAQLDNVYTQLAIQNHALLAPVGQAWQKALADSPKPDLYIYDGSHPTYSGSYLAASVFYSLIYGQRPPLPTQADAKRFQQVAAASLQQDAWGALQAQNVALRTLPNRLDMLATAQDKPQ